jgi:hypothetical protein
MLPVDAFFSHDLLKARMGFALHTRIALFFRHKLADVGM